MQLPTTWIAACKTFGSNMEDEMRKLNHSGQPLTSTYNELRKQPADYADADRQEIIREAGQCKPSLLKRALAWLNCPVEV